MTPIDISILEWLEETDLAAPPIQIHLFFPGEDEYRPTREHVNRRLRKLRDHDMVEKHPEADSLYQITEKGLRYLNDPNAKAEEFMPPPEDDEDEEEEDES